jgi:alkanesulfonate monooxygenase SsuD/methylene tetrahydromethanopterin reductase-like flavin-dependent oxidoreductase (luciferase family)
VTGEATGPSRVGLFVSGAQHLRGTDPRTIVAEHIRHTRLAHDAGLTTLLVGQHLADEKVQVLQPVPLLARLAAETDRMHLATGVLLASLLNPVQVAEEIATLDALTAGRAILGVGVGYKEVERRAFGLVRKSGVLLEEKIQVIKALLEGRPVAAEGDGYAIDVGPLALQPLQRPRPPIWIGANTALGIRRAARYGDSWLIGPFEALDELEGQLARYTTERGGRPPTLPLIREACVAPTDDEAQEACRRALMAKYDAYAHHGLETIHAADDRAEDPWDALRRDRFVVGSPATVAAQLRGLHDRLGVTEVILRVQWPGFDPALADRTLELLGREVMPALA